MLWKEVRDGIVRHAAPMRVVVDTAEVTVLFVDVGTRYFTMIDPAGDSRRVDRLTARTTKTWHSTRALHIVSPGEAHEVTAFWDAASGDFLCWYVDLQSPFERRSYGFHSRDHILDVVVTPDCGDARLKDVQELEHAAVVGWFTREMAEEIRREGDRVRQKALRRMPPFCDGWERWKPPAEWTVPDLPTDWLGVGER